MAEQVTAIVLAAQRAGVINPIAEAHGVSHKCLAPIAGQPLIKWVVEPLAAQLGSAMIRVVIEPEAFESVRPHLYDVSPRARVELVESRPGIRESVLAAAAGRTGPFLITTADNVLLSDAAITRMRAALDDGADVVAMLATKASVLAVHPQAQRGFYAFADGEYANCNLYALRDLRAFKAVRIFREGGQFMKNPQRLMRAFGLINILLVRFKLLSLAGAMKRLSRRFGLRFEALVPEDGAQAIDVDNERTYRIAESVLLKRHPAFASVDTDQP